MTRLVNPPLLAQVIVNPSGTRVWWSVLIVLILALFSMPIMPYWGCGPDQNIPAAHWSPFAGLLGLALILLTLHFMGVV